MSRVAELGALSASFLAILFAIAGIILPLAVIAGDENAIRSATPMAQITSSTPLKVWLIFTWGSCAGLVLLLLVLLGLAKNKWGLLEPLRVLLVLLCAPPVIVAGGLVLGAQIAFPLIVLSVAFFVIGIMGGAALGGHLFVGSLNGVSFFLRIFKWW